MEQEMAASGWPPELIAREKRRQEILDELAVKYPNLPFLTAVIIAGDLAGAEFWLERVKAGEYTVEKAANLVGSYARFGFAVDNCKPEYVYENIAELWRGSDPDDGEPRFLEVWRKAADHHHGVVTDGIDLPRRVHTVYRGQMEGDPFGISWTIDKDVASRFAKGAAYRTPVLGAIYRGMIVNPHEILGYLTGRGEQEIIIDPKTLAFTEVIARWEPVKK